MNAYSACKALVIGLCVTILVIYGMDQTLVRAVVGQYTVMGVVMLFGLAGLLLAAWIGLSFRTQKQIIRSQREDENGL